MDDIKQEVAAKVNPYEDTLRLINDTGYDHGDRTGVGRRSITGVMIKYDLSTGDVPVPTTRQVFYKGSIKELEWFIKGSSDAAELKALGASFWDRWCVKEENIDAFIEKYIPAEARSDALREAFIAEHLNKIGPMYGAMWRNAPNSQYAPFWPDIPMDEYPSDKLDLWKSQYEEMLEAGGGEIDITLEAFCKDQYYTTIDQLNELVRNLKTRPYSARLLITAWVPEFVPFESLGPEENVMLKKGSLAACHSSFQCFVRPPKEEGGRKTLSLLMYQRSADWPVGVPHNTTQYAVLLHVLAQVTDMDVGEFIHMLGDAHIYFSQIDKVPTQLEREPYPFPKIKINPELKDIFKFKASDVEIVGYESHPDIKYEVAK